MLRHRIGTLSENACILAILTPINLVGAIHNQHWLRNPVKKTKLRILRLTRLNLMACLEQRSLQVDKKNSPAFYLA
jgi:hypothetical protein